MTRIHAIRIMQLIIAFMAVILPVKIALIMDESNFRDPPHPLWWLALSLDTSASQYSIIGAIVTCISLCTAVVVTHLKAKHVNHENKPG